MNRFTVFTLCVFFLGVPCRCTECSFGCKCFAATNTVKCVSKDLRMVPLSILGRARTVIITGNNIRRIGPGSVPELKNLTNISLSNNRIQEVASHTFSAMPALRSLDLSGNQLVLIHPEALSIAGSPLRELNLSRALHNATSLTDLATALRWGALTGLRLLDLSGNGLMLLAPGMFSHLPDLRHLLLPDNSLASVYNGTFSGLHLLETLDLSRNAFSAFDADALEELGRLGNARLLLGHNPYACSCEICGFVAWLNASSQARVADAERVRCASPGGLRGTRLRGVGVQAIGCEAPERGEAGAELSLQTSYVFLGLVLGLVGVVFLLVLYLNRTGMKRWITEMRDACHDVLEGYHYRYQTDCDPRRGHLSLDGSAGKLRGRFGSAPSARIPPDTCVMVQMPTDTQLEEPPPLSPPGKQIQSG